MAFLFIAFCIAMSYLKKEEAITYEYLGEEVDSLEAKEAANSWFRIAAILIALTILLCLYSIKHRI